MSPCELESAVHNVVKKSSRNWLGTLWILWGLALLLFLGLWWVGLTKRSTAVLQAREVNVLNRLPDLEESFLGIEQLGLVLASTASQENSNAPLGSQRILELAAEGKPFYRFFIFSADSAGAPPWLAELCHRRMGPEIGVVEAIRPLPPGFETPSQGGTSSAPANYLAFAARGPLGEILLWQLDWDYVFGPWLEERLERFALGESLTAEFLVQDQLMSERGESSHASGLSRTWYAPTFLTDEVSNFGQLRLRLDNREALARERSDHLSLLFAGAVLMAGFALTLTLATRALRAKADYVETKARFVSMVGHELRTPITAIEMYLEILREGLVLEPDKISEYHDILQGESRRLKRLVENLLSLGLNESGGLELQLETFDLGELLNDVTVSENRENRSVEVRQTGHLMVRADRDALYGVFSNLLHNALKYSLPETKVEMVATGSTEGVLVEVSDRGPGLTEAEYSRVVEPYFRAADARATGHGLGLGLALAQQLVLAHEGRIVGRARSGGGSVFSVQLSAEDTLKNA